MKNENSFEEYFKQATKKSVNEEMKIRKLKLKKVKKANADIVKNINEEKLKSTKNAVKENNLHQVITNNVWDKEVMNNFLENKNLKYTEGFFGNYLQKITDAVPDANIFKNTWIKARQMIKILNPQNIAEKIFALAGSDIEKLFEILPDDIDQNPEPTQFGEAFYIEGQSVKDFMSELFPSLSFYPALQVWMVLEKAIKSMSFESLNPADLNMLAVYSAIFFGLVGSKIAKNRLKELYYKRKEAKVIEPQQVEDYSVDEIRIENKPGMGLVDDE